MRWLALLGLLASPAMAGTMYIDTAANGSASATNSGSTDTTSAKVSASSTITCSGTAGPGSTPGCSLSGSPDLSTVVTTAGATRDSIYLACATNSNQKIFWICAVDDGADTLSTCLGTSATTVTPTGCTASSSSFTIGGRAILTNASQEGTIDDGDVVIFNTSPASQAASTWTFRNNCVPRCWLRGKTGSRPVLTTSGSGNATVAMNTNQNGIENLEIVQSHVSNGTAINAGNVDVLIYNVKVSDAGTIGITNTSSSTKVIATEVTGATGDGINTNTNITVIGSYIHDNGGDGIENSANDPSLQVRDTVVDTNAGRGIYLSGTGSTTGAGLAWFQGVTVYTNGDSGLQVDDAETAFGLTNSIFESNGNAGGEYNVELAGAAESYGFHAWNTFYDNGSGDNLLNLTVNAMVSSSELTTDPLMTAPSTGNFGLGSTSPARGVGYPGQLLGATGQGYMSFGAQQVQGGGGGGNFIGGL